MLPYLIAGAIGFGIGKLFEEGGETFGRGGMTNEDILRSFLTSNRETQTNNLSTHYNQYDDFLLLRNYSTLIAIRKGNDVRITNIKYSNTTSKITNRLKALAEEMGYNVSYVSKFEEGGETFRRGGRTPKKVIKVRARGGYSLEDFFPLFEVYNEVVSYKKVGKLELQQILGKKDVADEFEFKTEADRDYWFEILNKEQEKYFTVQNKKKYVKYVLDNFGNYSEEAEDNGLKTLSEKLDYFADDLDYDLRLNTTREDFIYYLDLDVKDKYTGGGGVRKYAKGGLFGESAKLEYVDDAFASDELKSELQEKLGISSNDLGDNVVISFAYTDYGGDFLDKVAIRYFQENYPENTLVENTSYFGQNAYVFGEPAKEWIETTEDYPLGFEDFESYYYEKEYEQQLEDFDYFLDEISRDYSFNKNAVLNWLLENRSGYYNITTQGLDFSSSDLTDELVNEGLIEKIDEEDEFAEGGEAKKRRRRANAQTGRTDRSVDKTRVGKPVGYRFSNSLASKLRKDKYAVPTEKQITKYLGKGIYKENRKNRSDRDKIAKL